MTTQVKRLRKPNWLRRLNPRWLVLLFIVAMGTIMFGPSAVTGALASIESGQSAAGLAATESTPAITCSQVQPPLIELAMQYATILGEEPRKLYIVKAIAGDGTGSAVPLSGNFPICGPLVEPFSEVSNLLVRLDDDSLAYIIQGIVGWNPFDPAP